MQDSTKLEGSLSETRERIEALALAWGGSFEEPLLTLPVVSGLRRGAIQATVNLLADGDHTLIETEITEEAIAVNRAAAVLLLIGALAGIGLIIIPLVPSLWPLAPFGLIGAFGSWFLVVSRLTHAGLPQFLEQLEAEAVLEP